VRKGAAFALLPLLAEGAQIPIASARTSNLTIEIAAGPLNASLARFAEITGLSVGLAGQMPIVRTRPVSGKMTPDEALRVMLANTGLRARRMGGIFRIEPAPLPRHVIAPPVAPPPPPVLGSAPDIVVTAQKRPQFLTTVPVSLSVVTLGDLVSGTNALSSRDMSEGTEGLAMTNLGPGRNRQFIRGVADSPFNGQSQSTVAIQLDDARVTFDAPDPDLKLIDVDRVEILKGPQGPLYGSGALGGIYHIVTNRPDLDQASLQTRLSLAAVQHGGVGTGIEAVGNVPVLPGKLALRGVGYRLIEAGWLGAPGRRNSNAVGISGFRLSARWRPVDDWTVDAGVTVQNTDARDSQYVVESARTLSRNSLFPEPTDVDFAMGHATVEGAVGSLRLLSATSYVHHDYRYVLDASDAAAAFGLTAPVRFTDSRVYTLFNQEVRLSSEGADHWLVGASLLRATSSGRSLAHGAGDVSQVVERLDRHTTEMALFGEMTRRIWGDLAATVGARVSRSIAEDVASEKLGDRALSRTKIILSPSASLSLRLDDRGILYLRYARAMRPGGLAPAGETASGRFDADELDTLDLGIRRQSEDGRLALSGGAYAMRWTGIQSDYLLPDGLISTRNAGQGRIFGLEAAVDWRLGAGVSVSAGAALQDARLTRTQNGVELDDTRLPVTPGMTARLSVAKTVAIRGWRGRVVAEGNYIGSARLSFDSDLDREMGEYAQFGLHAEMSRGAWGLNARIDNLTDVKGDSFAFGNPFSIREGPQYTPVRPRTLILSVARAW
jgi:outer membrane receptor protein involved in Fe transport